MTSILTLAIPLATVKFQMGETAEFLYLLQIKRVNKTLSFLRVPSSQTTAMVFPWESWVLQPASHTLTAQQDLGIALGIQLPGSPSAVRQKNILVGVTPAPEGASIERSRCLNPILDSTLHSCLN